MLSCRRGYQTMSGYGDERTPPDGYPVGHRYEEIPYHEDPDHARHALISASVGDKMTVPLSIVRPSQLDDGVENSSTDPIDVYLEWRPGEGDPDIFVQTGNHRYYTRQNRGDEMTQVKKVLNPYLNY